MSYEDRMEMARLQLGERARKVMDRDQKRALRKQDPTRSESQRLRSKQLREARELRGKHV